ncbi:nudC domain-containing protein 1 isoform X3 [Sciurus carolinensis]|uniref:nudC domain-containing protein 1 isoform X3 n=1 Tax=Sciurus carolinensis TaxID=30640 RepID=UPI001FB462D8|nr:nudC domain-containing protein 1 isoform X3 [Sciurus carolinensis]
MEVAANCSLRVKRPLLDPRFEGYKLSLEPLPCYQLELDAAVAEVKLRDDQYTLEHMHAFGMYNYLHCDSWYQDSVYYIDNLGRIMNLTVMLDTALGKPREVFRLPTDLTACDNRLCASIHFTSSTWVTLSDGTGRLYVIGTGERGNSASEKWEMMFNEELGDPFIIIHSISLLKAEEHSIAILILRIEKEEQDMKGSGFYVSLEWVTISKKNKDNKKYEITKHDILRGKSVPHYAAIEPNGNGLMIVSYKSFKFVQVDQDLEENMDEDMSEKIRVEPLYYWQQTEDDLTVTVRLPENSVKDDVQVQFLPDHINIMLRNCQLLEGKLYSSVDHESSTWIIKENNSLEIFLIKKNEGLTWPELVVGDKQGELIRDSAQCAAIAERLMHLTSEELNPNPDKEKPPCNAQELEECDIFFEESSSLCRFDGSTLKTTHVGLAELLRLASNLAMRCLSFPNHWNYSVHHHTWLHTCLSMYEMLTASILYNILHTV